MQRVKMYNFHERVWHWVQALVMLLLMWTGFVLHRPDLPLGLGFAGAESLHRWFGLALALNALLGFLYHIFSSEIFQFIPRSTDFSSLAIRQARYYMSGIFRGEEHPVEKTRNNKLNPLQKITYFMLLNFLLPGQLISGIVLWLGHANLLGMLPAEIVPLLVKLHLLLAWLFVVFLLTHIYLATTGLRVSSNFMAMITGWEDLPVHENQKEPGDSPVPGRGK